MNNVIDKDKFKEFTDNVKSILVYGVNRDNPKEYFFTTYDSFKECLKVDKTYLHNIIKFMREAGLLTRESSDSHLELSPRGINIGQDIARGTYWVDAVEICEQNELYSLDSIVYTVGVLIRKSIIEKINNELVQV